MARAFDHLPDDIIIQILASLPVKSLLRFSSVCKSWCLFFKDPRFVSQHLHRSIVRTNGGNHLIKSHLENPTSNNHAQKITPFCLDMFSNVNETIGNTLPQLVPLHIPLELKQYGYQRMVFSNGLLFLDGVFEGINGNLCLLEVYVVWNLATRQLKEIPYKKKLSDDGRGLYGCGCLVGFCFGEETSDCNYKIVEVHVYKNMTNGLVARAKIYSRLTGSWRDIDTTSFPNYETSTRNYKNLRYLSSHIVKGVLYWIPEKSIIIGFSIRDEMFCKLQIPDLIDNFRFDSVKLTEVKGSLALITYNDCYSNRHIYDTWVMKEDGKGWYKKFSVVQYHSGDFHQLVGHCESFLFFHEMSPHENLYVNRNKELKTIFLFRGSDSEQVMRIPWDEKRYDITVYNSYVESLVPAE